MLYLSVSSLAATVISAIVGALEASGPAGLGALIGLMAVESFGLPPLPSEVILPLAGYLIATGADPYFTWPSVLAGALVGSLAGSLLAHDVGRRLGLPFVLRFGARVGLKPEDLTRTEAFFERRGPIAVCLARLVPIIRAYISYPAGAAKMGRARFSVYTLCGAVPFTLLLVYAGYVLGRNWGEVAGVWTPLEYVVGAVLLGLLVYLAYRLHTRSRTARPSPKPSSPEGEGLPPTSGP